MRNKQFEEQFLQALTEKVMQGKVSETVQSEEQSAEGSSDAAESYGTSLRILDRRMQRHFRCSRLLAAAGKAVKTAAMFVAVLLISGILLLCFSNTARAAFERWTHDIYENRMRYIFHGKPEEEYKLPMYEAGWLPEGVKLVEMQGDNPEKYGYTLLYMSDDESIIIVLGVDAVVEGSLTELTQMEGYEHETIQFEGKIIEDYYRGDDDRTAFWFMDDDKAFVIVDCSLTREELLKFIKHLRQIN